jgi:type VI secretion system secreted protein Hcp
LGLIIGAVCFIGVPIVYVLEKIGLEGKNGASKKKSGFEKLQETSISTLEERIIDLIERKLEEPIETKVLDRYFRQLEESIETRLAELLREKTKQKTFTWTRGDYYLKIDSIKGESEATGFEGQLEVISWSFGATNTGLSVSEISLNVESDLSDFHFVVQNSEASPWLFFACAKGNQIPQAVLNCRKTGGDGNRYTYTKVKFGNIVISSFKAIGNEEDAPFPIEQISFSFENITFEYFQQRWDGSVSLTASTSYDTKKAQARTK